MLIHLAWLGGEAFRSNRTFMELKFDAEDIIKAVKQF